jgi:hypothetical protein
MPMDLPRKCSGFSISGRTIKLRTPFHHLTPLSLILLTANQGRRYSFPPLQLSGDLIFISLSGSGQPGRCSASGRAFGG